MTAAAGRPVPSRLVLLGHPVAHSLSPRFHNAALRAAGIPVTYEALDTPPERLGPTLEMLRREGAGGNVTIPHKEAVRVACDRLTPLAERVGAVNTFWTEGDVLCGDNTDVAGFERALRALLGREPHGLRIGLLGAGGAARAVLAAVERWDGEGTVVLHNRSRRRAEALAGEFPVVRAVVATPSEAARDADVVVNASPVGLQGDEVPLDLAAIPPLAVVLDLVYRAGGTPWVRAALERGHRASDGLTMLLEQGAEAFRRWFGVEPDRAVMRAALR